jgi:hypothetical protein
MRMTAKEGLRKRRSISDFSNFLISFLLLIILNKGRNKENVAGIIVTVATIAGSKCRQEADVRGASVSGGIFIHSLFLEKLMISFVNNKSSFLNGEKMRKIIGAE